MISTPLTFDSIDEWAPSLGAALEQHIPPNFDSQIRKIAPKYIEDALSFLFDNSDRQAIIESGLSWIRLHHVMAYHGSRLNKDDVSSIRRTGLLPLRAEQRRTRLVRALSPHPDWHEVSEKLDETIELYGDHEFGGRRQGQVHLTLSRSGLVNSFSHYVTHGSEIDQHIAQHLLEQDGKLLLAEDGRPVVFRVVVSGEMALKAAHPIWEVQDVLDAGDIPNLVNQFLRTWCFKAAYPEYQSSSLRADCGLIFYEQIPPTWIVQHEFLTPDNIPGETS